ncbi:hypothetical protein [Streptomyces lancefieldiae]|uniref:Uncharacterized protein n=1 Tax=Streptomyces lancefieldiae TaxID=3075520 RepID=A0ABU3B1I9_9ACTN|nr:hypothetical protein [Streptomyces sp. DSM 40712]MDT0615148.1 hypothetical protein [Streptomyces sp. DSM 40712]
MAAEQHPGGYDALMAAITGEPLPPDAGADAEAEYRSAAADVTLLREQLDVLGRALGEPPPAPDAGGAARRTPAHRPRRRPPRLALGVLAAACAGVVVTGLGWLVVQGESAREDAASDSAAAGGKGADSAESGAVAFGSPRYLACARLVTEGTVTGAEPVPGETGQHRITLDVTRSYKPEERPAKGGERITFVLDDGTARLAEGDHALIGVPLYGDTPDAVITGEEAVAAERARVTAALPESRTLTCD